MNIDTENKMAEALVASGVEPDFARTLVRSQATCVVCAGGMIVKAPDELICAEDQVVLDASPANVRVHIHGFCLTNPGAGKQIARALGFRITGS